MSQIIDMDKFTFIGLYTQCKLPELPVEVPKLWAELERRKDEIAGRVNLSYRIGLFLGRDDELLSEAVGFVVQEDTPVLEGMVKVEVPAYRYALASHRGMDVKGSYARLFKWILKNELQIVPDEEAFHHLEWYPEASFENSIEIKREFEIFIRLQ